MADDETTNIAECLQTLAKNLEWHMHSNGMSENALARASGISPRTIGNFLRPNNRKSKRGTSRSFPSGTLANLVKLAKVFDIEAWELLRKRDVARAHFLATVEAAYIERHKADLAEQLKQHRR